MGRIDNHLKSIKTGLTFNIEALENLKTDLKKYYWAYYWIYSAVFSQVVSENIFDIYTIFISSLNSVEYIVKSYKKLLQENLRINMFMGKNRIADMQSWKHAKFFM